MRLVALLLIALPAVAAEERPLVGDPVNGARLLQKAGANVAVDGAWLNTWAHDVAVEKLQKGKDGFARIDSENVLDRWDALAALMEKNTDIQDLLMGGDTLLVVDTKLDEHAEARLRDQAQIASSAIQPERKVFGVYKLGAALAYVYEKETKKRDKLKKDTKVGYVVFTKIPGFRGGGYEAAFAIDKDIRIAQVLVRAPDGSAPADLNQAAARFVGKGARGQYAELKAGGAGKAVGELQRPLSDAFLLAAESVYMFEVGEREFFQFGG
jgi:hypothetical protein